MLFTVAYIFNYALEIIIDNLLDFRNWYFVTICSLAIETEIELSLNAQMVLNNSEWRVLNNLWLVFPLMHNRLYCNAC